MSWPSPAGVGYFVFRRALCSPFCWFPGAACAGRGASRWSPAQFPAESLRRIMPSGRGWGCRRWPGTTRSALAAAAYAQQMAFTGRVRSIPTARRGEASARICGWAAAGRSASKRWSAAGHRRSATSRRASFPNDQPHRQLGGRRPLHADDLADDARASAARSRPPRASIISSAAIHLPAISTAAASCLNRDTTGQRSSLATQRFAVTALRMETCSATSF